jgi:beta-galactosidase
VDIPPRVERLRTEVKAWRDAPTLFVNGSPDTGLMFWHSRVESGAVEVAGLGKRGIDLVSAGFSAGIQPEGDYDHAATDARIRAILAANPGALILPRVSVVPPEWWLELHPSERMVHLDQATGERTMDSGGRVSFASQRWRTELGEALRSFVAHCEENWQSHILGYHVGGGQFGEWSYSWENVLSDYSDPQAQAFRAWLRDQYGRDAEKLRAAWGDAAAAFDEAEVPRTRTRRRGEHSILDPSREQPTIDYLTFHSFEAADAALWFAGEAKRALSAAGSTKVVGIFYGYHFFDAAIPACLHNCGHHALTQVLASRHVDFLCAPYSYLERHAGGIFISQLVAGSVSLHGKLLWSEEDTRTHLAPASAAYGRCTTFRSTVGTLRRNLVGAVGAGGSQWWMDLAGEGWYLDEALLDAVGELRTLAVRLQEAGRAPTSQVAVIASKQSLPYFRQDDALTDPLLSRQLSELCHSGFPFDTFLAEDIRTVFSQPWSKGYRLVVFLDAVLVPPEQREAIRDLVAREGRILLWAHAAGLVTPHGFDAAAARELTGFTVHVGDPLYPDQTYPVTVETSVSGTRVAYGAAGRVGPILFGEDPDAAVLGWLIHPDRPGLLYRDFGTWRSVWSAAPGMPAPVLRAIAEHAGVHIYTDTGDQVLTSGPFVAVHATDDGTRTVHFPAPSSLFDAVTDRPVAQRVARIDVELERGDTVVWRVETGKQGA